MDTRERVAGLLCDPKSVVYPCPMCFAKATAILRIVDEERAELVKALSAVLDDWQDGYAYDLCESYSKARAALGERR